ncbi:MAG: SusD/RagB family nutrient-binding outer membrane lipoprotein [Bacteroidales bacterium]
MKRIYIWSMLFILIFADSCSKFEEMNTNPDKSTMATPAMLATGALISTLKQGGDSKAYITLQALPKYVGYVESSALNEQYNKIGTCSFGTYTILPNLKQMVEYSAGSITENSYKGLALFLKAFNAFRVSMQTGDIPYSEAGFGKDGLLNPIYDTQENVFKQILADLKQAEEYFAVGRTFGGDIVYNGDPVKWRKLCNTFQLKVIMSMSKRVDAATKARFAAIVAAGNIMASNADNFQLNYANQTGNYHPLYQAQKFTAATMISDNLVQILKKLNDKRLFYYAEPSAYQLTHGKVMSDPDAYIGVNVAISYTQLAGIFSSGNVSLLNRRYAFLYASEPLVYVGYPEQNLIIAEAIELGWMTGSSQTYYETGVKAALAFTMATDVSYAHGVPIDQAYINGYFTGQAAYKTSSADRLKQIWEQRYLFNYFQDGTFAYFEFRRNGYPQFPLDPATNLNAENVNGFPMRWTYPSGESQSNKDNLVIALDRQYQGFDEVNKLMWVLK